MPHLVLLFIFLSNIHAQTCISHRMNGFDSQENSREALQNALASGVSGLEIDVQISKEGIPFIYHDSKLGKGLIGPNCLKGTKIKNLSFKEIEESCFLNNGSSLLTLKEALRKLEGFSGYVFIDLKKRPSQEFFNIFENSSLFNHNLVRFISFKKRALRPLKKRWPHVETILLSRYIPRGLFYSGVGFNKRLNFFAKPFRMLGKKTSIWTLNSSEDILDAVKKRADFIITDNYQMCDELVSGVR